MPKTEQPIGERLLAARKKRGLTREAAAGQNNVSPSRWRSWEKGFNEPVPEMVPVLEKWLRNGGSR